MKRFLVWTAAMITLSGATGCKSHDTKASHSQILSDKQEVRIGLSDTVSTLDPRMARGFSNANLVQLLFEGLTRTDQKGNILPGTAESIQPSADMRSYTFQLRDCKWSNGEPVTAYDFEESWKSQLKPETKAPTGYMLFPIKGAKAAFEGTGSIDDVGIHALDNKTLLVTLENPTPYFLQLTATSSYFPINKQWVSEHSEWKEDEQHACVSNGPFALSSWKDHEAIILEKNPNYWDKESVRLTKIDFPVLDDFAATTLFEQGRLDWVGSPVSAITRDAYDGLKANDTLHNAPAAGTQFLRVNVEQQPFTNQKMRKAFFQAINSQAIIDQVMQGSQQAATSFVPPALGLEASHADASYDVAQAQTLFEEALAEMNMSRQKMPTITLAFPASDRGQKMAEMLKSNWKEAFDVDVQLKPCDNRGFYDTLFAKDYTLASGSWFADYFDPMSFLSIFQYRENGTNNTQWANAEYTKLLEDSCRAANPQERLRLLQAANDILMQEMPVLPLFYYSFSFAKNKQLQAELSPFGLMQLNQAYVVTNP